LRVKSLIGAAVLTWLSVLLVWFTVMEMDGMIQTNYMVVSGVMVLLCNGAYVALTFFLLRHSLSRRIYSF
jgi:uncharacterized membrane-anchored protein